MVDGGADLGLTATLAAPFHEHHFTSTTVIVGVHGSDLPVGDAS
jgi:hypothetical protein